MRATLLAAAGAVTLFCASGAAQVAAQVTLLTNATVIDGTGAPPRFSPIALCLITEFRSQGSSSPVKKQTG